MTDKDKSSWKFRLYVIVALIIVAGLLTNFIPFDLGQEFLHLPQGVVLSESAGYWDFINAFTLGYFAVAILVAGLAALVSFGTRDIFEVIGLFLVGMLPRERKQWGVVFDQKTKQPMAFLPVRIYAQQQDQWQMVAETKTDSDGRYRLAFAGNKGQKYSIQVAAEGYQHYSQELESFLVSGANDIVNDIPLHNAAQGQVTALSYFYRNRPKYYRMLFLGIYVMYWLIFGVMVFFLINDPLFGNLLAFALMLVTVVWNTRIIRDHSKPVMGKVVVVPEHKPIVGATVELTLPVGNAIAVSDAQGVVRFTVAAGVYRASVKALGFTMLGVDTQGFKILKVGKEGYVTQDMSMQSISTPQVITPRTLLVT